MATWLGPPNVRPGVSYGFAYSLAPANLLVLFFTYSLLGLLVFFVCSLLESLGLELEGEGI